MNASLSRLVWQRAGAQCEYCQTPHTPDDPFEIDHAVAQKHGGPTVASNLCLSCLSCNSFKGSDLASIDPKTRKLTPLYNPRRHRWAKHFRWEGPVLVARTAIGRVTIKLLHINDDLRVAIRRGLIEEGSFPPP